jgi:predicted TIM-barrel fold metal-dependent hydrolase
MRAEKDRIIDIHQHAFPAENLVGALLKPHQHAKLNAAVLEDTIEQMDRLGIVKGLISGPNNIVAEWVKRAPDRFIPCWMPNLPPLDPDEEAARFIQAIENLGIQGLGELLLPLAGIPLNDRRFFPLYQICQERQLVAFFHTGLTAPNYPRTGIPFRMRLSDPLLLEDVAAVFPDLKMVICHMSYPFTEQATYMLYAHSNVYMDVGVVNWILGRAGFHRLLRDVVETVGSDKVLFGSDQMLSPDRIPVAVSAIQEASFLSEEEKRKILGENALRILGVADSSD